MLKEDQNKLYTLIRDYIPKGVLSRKNKASSWKYGYNERYDFVNISKSGKVGEIIDVSGLKIGLPLYIKPKKKTSKDKQYWQRHELPSQLSKINSIFQWNTMDSVFKERIARYLLKKYSP